MLRGEQNHYETQKAVLPHMRFPVRRRVCGSGLARARGPDPHRVGEDRHQQPPGNEIKAAQYVKSLLDAQGILSEIVESAPGRAKTQKILASILRTCWQQGKDSFSSLTKLIRSPQQTILDIAPLRRGRGGVLPERSCQDPNYIDFSAPWTRTINFEGGKWRFAVTADDGARLYIDS